MLDNLRSEMSSCDAAPGQLCQFLLVIHPLIAIDVEHVSFALSQSPIFSHIGSGVKSAIKGGSVLRPLPCRYQ